MTVDPFAAPAPIVVEQPTDPWASAPSEPETPTKSVGTVSVDVKPNFTGGWPVSEGKVVLTFKGGTGFEAPWIVIHAADLEDAHRQVTEEAALLASLMDRVQKAGSHFAASGPVNTGRGGNTGSPSSPPQGATSAPAWAPAPHQPDAVYKTGVSAASGKVWHAWMSPQKGGYEPLFFYPPK